MFDVHVHSIRSKNNAIPDSRESNSFNFLTSLESNSYKIYFIVKPFEDIIVDIMFYKHG
jgi:hypothetical protein